MLSTDPTVDFLKAVDHRWLVTGAAGFIGSNIVETLLRGGQRVVGLDNFATGHQRNLLAVRAAVGQEAWSRFTFHKGDVRNAADCVQACAHVDVVLHQAALGSVPRSLRDPATTNAVNIDGTLAMLIAARDAGVRRFVYAASSSTYGDHPGLPKREELIGRPLSPYAVTKYVNELYADVFHRSYGLATIGLRYFNVFGPRQDPDGAYAAVVPKWVGQLMRGEQCVINGDGETTRDFCYVANAVQANVRAALVEQPDAVGQVYNVSVGERTTLNSLFEMIREGLARLMPHDLRVRNAAVSHADFRSGDVRHSQADISKARELLGYLPTHDVRQGLAASLAWYAEDLRQRIAS
jgi:UDP-N-acetylglucosamine 4-epimerase